MPPYFLIKYRAVTVLLLAFVAGCEQPAPPAGSNEGNPDINAMVSRSSPIDIAPSPALEQPAPERRFQNISYLYNTEQHSLAELETLLQRTDEVLQSSDEKLDNFKIALVIHGPDIEFFRKKNYPANQKMIDLAEKLDAMQVMEFKICESSLHDHGINLSEMPAFMEPVPLASDELNRLENEGYTSF